MKIFKCDHKDCNESVAVANNAFGVPKGWLQVSGKSIGSYNTLSFDFIFCPAHVDGNKVLFSLNNKLIDDANKDVLRDAFRDLIYETIDQYNELR